MKQNQHLVLRIFNVGNCWNCECFGITLLMTPVKLYDSGISGTSMLLEPVSPSYLSLSLFLLILNIPLFLIGLKK